jgi:glycerol uptake facilitator-like aquaporin
MRFLGPITISTVWQGCMVLVTVNSRGPINPNVALNVWFYSLVAYNHKDSNNLHPNETHFNYNHFGRYTWIYILAPFVASLIAGYIARLHLGLKDIKNPYRVNRDSLASSTYSKAGFL